MRTDGSESERLRRWQGATVALAVVGYAGYYLCRSNFSVALPLLVDELAAGGVERNAAKIRLGGVASFGVLAYALGKFVAGGVAERLGGRRSFLGGMLGASLFTAAFALGAGLPFFTLAWMANRAVQSLGWPGMVKLASRWFGPSSYGAAMGAISLSYLFGDAVARSSLGALLAAGFGWRGAFGICAALLLALLAVCAALLRESPGERGLPEPAASADTLFGPSGSSAHPESVRTLLGTLLASRAFWLVCGLSLGLTLVRESFNTWTPTYFTEGLGLDPAEAAAKSALFPLAGGVAVLLAGVASDRIGRGGRAWIVLAGIVGTTGALLVLAQGSLAGDAAVWWVAGLAFLILAPYSYLAGAIALDFGGKQGSATACGIIDGVGYLGGILAGDAMARLSVASGWGGAFGVLAAVAAATSVVALLFVREQR